MSLCHIYRDGLLLYVFCFLLPMQYTKHGKTIKRNNHKQVSGFFFLTAIDFSPFAWHFKPETMVRQTPSLPGIEGSDEFLATIQELTNMVDEQEVRDTYTYLFNYDVGNVLDIPLTYQKDMIVYNTDKIAGYTFTGTPYFFDILSLEPAE